MIDEKKIEEAAQGAADLYEQDLPIMSYYEDTEVDGQHHFCQEFGAELFKDGAKWAIQEFLKDLWHPAEEEPDKSKSDIITLGFDNDAYLQFKESILWNEESWRHSSEFIQQLQDVYDEEGDMEIAIKIDDNDLGSEPIVVKSTVYEQLYIVKS